MKTEEELLGRARECVAAELDRRLVEASKRLPHRCVHNHRQVVDSRPTVEGEPNSAYNTVSREGSPTIGLCMLGAESPEEWAGTICEDPIDAQRCPYFTPSKTKEAILREVSAELSDAEWLTHNMPELATLLWVLEETTAPRYSWWRRLLLFFWRVQIEPLQPVFDPAKLLPDNENPRP